MITQNYKIVLFVLVISRNMANENIRNIFLITIYLTVSTKNPLKFANFGHSVYKTNISTSFLG